MISLHLPPNPRTIGNRLMSSIRPFTLLWLLVLGMIPWRPVAAAPEPIRHFADVRSLSRANAAMGMPVEIEGVVIRQSYMADLTD